LRFGGDPRSDADRNSTGFSVDDFDLACVQPGADLDPDVVHRLDDGLGTANSPRWAVERGVEAVSSGVEFFASIARK
jgi:hypothetical protein